MNRVIEFVFELKLIEILNSLLFSFLLLNILPWEYEPAQHQVNQENYSNANLWATWITKCCLNGLKKRLYQIVQISEQVGRSILTIRFRISSYRPTFQRGWLSHEVVVWDHLLHLRCLTFIKFRHMWLMLGRNKIWQHFVIGKLDEI